MPQENERIIPIELGEGIDAGKDPKLVAGWTKLENIDTTKRGELRKRPGQVRSTAAQSDIDQIFAYGGSIVGIGAAAELKVYDVDDDSWTTGLTEPQHWLEHAIRDLIPVRATSGTRQAEMVRLGSFIVLAAYDTDSGSCVLYAIDETTGARTSVTLGETYFRLIKMSDSLAYLYYGDNATSQVHRRSISDAGVIGSASAITTITNPDTATAPYLRLFDACLVSSGGTDYVAVIWGDTSTVGVKCAFLPDGGDASATTATLDASPTAFHDNGFACWPKGEYASFAWADDTGFGADIYVEDRDVAATQQLAPWSPAEIGTTPQEPLMMIVGYGANHSGHGDAGTIYIVTSDSSSITDCRHTYEYDLVDNAGTYEVDTDWDREMPFHCPAAKPISDGGGGWMLPMAVSVRHPAQFAIAEVEGRSTIAFYAIYFGGQQARLTLCGSAAYGLADHVSRPGAIDPVTGAYGDMIVPRAVDTTRSKRSRTEYLDTGLTLWSMLSVRSHVVHGDERDGVLLLSGSLPRQWDRQSATLVERGFLQYPEVFGATRLSDGGTPYLDAGGTYSYAFTYEWDSDGRRHQSIPTLVDLEADAQPTTGQTKMFFQVPALSCTEKNNVRIVAWRTENGGTRFYRAAVTDNDPEGGGLRTGFVDFYDTTTDSALVKNEPLYTSGGVLENAPSGPYSHSCVHQKREVLAPMESDGDLRYSRQKVDREPYLHHEILSVELDDPGGPVVAVASADDKIFAYKQRSIFASQGQGYTENGGGEGYYPPYIVSHKIGAADKRSLIRIQGGTAFVSGDVAMELSSTGLKPIGDEARHYFETATIVGGVSLADRRKAAWLASDGAAVVYDWMRGQWMTWSGHLSTSACVVDDKLARLDSSGYVHVESSSLYSDNGAFYAMSAETGWISLAGIRGFQHLVDLALVGSFIEDCGISIQWGFDFDPVWSSAYQIDLGANLQPFASSQYYGAGLSSPTYDHQAMVLVARPPKTRVTAFRVRIVDTEKDAADTESFTLSALAIRARLLPGRYAIDGNRSAQ